jgi:hypothetical protein
MISLLSTNYRSILPRTLYAGYPIPVNKYCIDIQKAVYDVLIASSIFNNIKKKT